MINVDLRRYGTDKEYEKFVNGLLSNHDQEINADNWREHRSEAMDIKDLPCELVRSIKEATDEEIQEILGKKGDKDGRNSNED